MHSPIAEEAQRRFSRQNSRVSLQRSESKEMEFQSNNSLGGKKSSIEGGMRRKPSGPGQGGPEGRGDGKGTGNAPRRGQKLIEKEKAEVGNVRLDIYKYYLENVGYVMIFFIFIIQLLSQGFGVGSNAWLGEWADDDTLVKDGVVNLAKRDMYLAVYGVIGLAQGKLNLLNLLFSNINEYYFVERRLEKST